MLELNVSLDQKCVYELSAVLIHRGISAYSGHYIAHVKDARTGDWYKFNDEEIEKMEGKKLQLGIEEDIGETKIVKESSYCKPAEIFSYSKKICFLKCVVAMTMLF